MTPALVALSRAYTELPGALTVPAACCSDECANIGHLRADDGTRWVFVPEAGYEDIGAGEWIFDLTDAATGGVMLARLGDAVGIVEIGPDRIGLRYDSDCPTLGEGATLAEAVARVAVAVGRAG